MWETEGNDGPHFQDLKLFPKYEGRLERRGVLIDAWKKNGAAKHVGWLPTVEPATELQ